jgi:hypothetical protein
MHPFSLQVNRYIMTQRSLQLEPIEDKPFGSMYTFLDDQRKTTAKERLFYAAYLYRVITEHFWVKGGRYFMPDKWADTAIENLHNDLMEDVLLKYVKKETQLHEFYKIIESSEVDSNLKDLNKAFTAYQDWLRKEDIEVNHTAAYSQAYSDLFGQQMDRLYKDWFERGLLQAYWRSKEGTRSNKQFEGNIRTEDIPL